MGMTSSADGPADETNLTGVGEIRLIPDMSTKCRIPCYMQKLGEVNLSWLWGTPLVIVLLTTWYSPMRLYIRAVARKHGLLATFLPKYALDDIGSGSHVHLSLYQDGENVFMATSGTSRYGMSIVGQEFMAGVLHHLSAILAFTAPLPNS